MPLESPWFYLALMAVVMAFSALPVFRFLDTPGEGPPRHVAIDGLRGFLALGVFVFHFVLMRRFVQTGVWAVPDSHFYGVLGPIGVSVFFMLTGFLFWGKLLRARGRPDWRALYIGRLFRIGPMYLVVVVAMLAIVAARTGFELREPARAVASAAAQWLALGMIDTQPDVNGFRAVHVLAGVTWTLWYEWVFYASLVAWAALARRRSHLPIVLAALLLCLAVKRWWHLEIAGYGALFAIGMAVASLRHQWPPARLSDRARSAIAVLCLAGAFAAPGTGYGSGTALLLAPFFLMVCSGATLFGLLTTRAAQRLGTVSYSLYLMQGLVLTVVLTNDGPIARFAFGSVAAYWIVGTACAVLLLACAAIGHALVEVPGMALGRRVARARARPAAVPVSSP